MKKNKNILIVNTALIKDKSYANSIKGLLRSVNCDIVSYRKIKDVSYIDSYDGVILSGQPVSDMHHTKKSVELHYHWIRDVDVPLIGFCGGHQIIALAYGASLIKNVEAEPKGFFAAYAKGRYLKDPIFKEIRFGRYGNVFIVYNKHMDSVTLPKDFVLLASTDRCKNALMRHKKKIIYGAQFHPEDPDYYGRKHGINQQTNQDSDSMVTNFEDIVVNNP